MDSGLSSNFFELFALPVAYVVDQAALTSRYRDLQQAMHPDRFVTATDQERRISMQRATQINEAFQTLKDPLARARYLLQLKGVEADDENNTVMDTVFLMEQMELREALAEVREKDDPLDEVGTILDDVARRIRALTSALEASLVEQSEAALQQASDLVRKLQFLYKLREEAEGLEADLEDEV